jgi:hypothetical protein
VNNMWVVERYMIGEGKIWANCTSPSVHLLLLLFEITKTFSTVHSYYHLHLCSLMFLWTLFTLTAILKIILSK